MINDKEILEMLKTKTVRATALELGIDRNIVQNISTKRRQKKCVSCGQRKQKIQFYRIHNDIMQDECKTCVNKKEKDRKDAHKKMVESRRGKTRFFYHMAKV